MLQVMLSLTMHFFHFLLFFSFIAAGESLMKLLVERRAFVEALTHPHILRVPLFPDLFLSVPPLVQFLLFLDNLLALRLGQFLFLLSDLNLFFLQLLLLFFPLFLELLFPLELFFSLFLHKFLGFFDFLRRIELLVNILYLFGLLLLLCALQTLVYFAYFLLNILRLLPQQIYLRVFVFASIERQQRRPLLNR